MIKRKFMSYTFVLLFPSPETTFPHFTGNVLLTFKAYIFYPYSILKKRPWLSCHAGLQFGHSEETPRFYKRTLDTSCAHLHMLSDHLFNHRSLLQQPTVCRCNLIAAQLSCTHLSFSLPHPTSEVYVHVWAWKGMRVTGNDWEPRPVGDECQYTHILLLRVSYR